MPTAAAQIAMVDVTRALDAVRLGLQARPAGRKPVDAVSTVTLKFALQ